jgi:hypothetical protein
MMRRVMVALLRLTFSVLAFFTVLHYIPTFGQTKPERFWVAGRYDGDRVLVYFDSVKFEGTMNANSHRIAPPVVEGFFQPAEVSQSYIARFQKAPNSERFAIGDRYDLLLGNGVISTITLTALVGCETDEQVGNDSFIGALATVEKQDALIFTRGYYAVRRNQERDRSGAKSRPNTTTDSLKSAGLREEPIRFDVETRIASLLNARMKTATTEAEKSKANNVPPALQVQPFRVADGSLRYYVRAEWKSGKESGERSSFVLGAWVTPSPSLRVLAVENRTSPYGFEHGLPKLLNAVDLGGGRTGIIVSVSGEDSTEIKLVEYHDGANTKGMPVMQSIATAE